MVRIYLKGCLLVALAAPALLAAGCGSDDESSGGSSAASSSNGDAAAKQVSISYLIPSLNNEAFKIDVESAKAAAQADGNVDFKVFSGTSDTDISQQVANLRTAAVQNPDAIIAAPSDPKAIARPLEKAGENTKIVVVGSPIPGYEPDALVLFPDLAGGEAAGKFMAEIVPDGARVGILSCFPGQFPQIEDRVRGAKSQWEGKNYDIVATLDAQCDNAKGRRAMADLLTAHPDVDAVFSVSDSQTIGALSAIKQAGKDVTIVSYDAQPTVVEKVKTGEVAGTVDIDLVRGGKEALRLAAAAARGEDHEKMVNVPPRIINKDNVDEFEASAG